jgi:hypothetical protein
MTDSQHEGTGEVRQTAAQAAIPLLSLLLFSGLSIFPFVFSGLATGDSIRYALGLRDILAHGPSEIPHVFNGEMSFGYYLLLDGLIRVLGLSGDPSGLMNMTSAVCAFFLQGFLFLFFARMLKCRLGALTAGVAVLLSPSLWFLSHYGHPVLPAMTTFAGSLLVLDRLMSASGTEDDSGVSPPDKAGARATLRERLLWLLFVLLATATLVLRLDLVLAFGAYFGLVRLHRPCSRSAMIQVLGATMSALLLLFALRRLALGYWVNPLGGTVAYHLTTRMSVGLFPRSIIKNLTLWVFATNALVALLAAIGLARGEVRSRFGFLVLCWITPWCIFLPFRGMDVARIIAPTIPAIVLVAVATVLSIFRRARVAALFAMLVLAQLVSVAVYGPLVHAYPFQREIDGHVLAAFPLGFPPVDQVYRQRAITMQTRIASKVTNERGSDVLIMGRAGLMDYIYLLRTASDTKSVGEGLRGRVVLDSVVTAQNIFYLLDLDYEGAQAGSIEQVMASLASRRLLVHFMPFWREHPATGEQLFWTPSEARAVLERERSKAE